MIEVVKDGDRFRLKGKEMVDFEFLTMLSNEGSKVITDRVSFTTSDEIPGEFCIVTSMDVAVSHS
jgi:hypothetical protein